MAQNDNERTPLLNHSGDDDEEGGDNKQKNVGNPVNLSKSKVATILAANWVCHARSLEELSLKQAHSLTACTLPYLSSVSSLELLIVRTFPSEIDYLGT